MQGIRQVVTDDPYFQALELKLKGSKKLMKEHELTLAEEFVHPRSEMKRNNTLLLHGR